MLLQLLNQLCHFGIQQFTLEGLKFDTQPVSNKNNNEMKNRTKMIQHFS